jgi:DivIVA domain-containing protein
MTSDTSESATPVAPFPDAPGRSKGYEKRAVDAFLSRAKDSFDLPLGEQGTLSAVDIRQVAFPLVKHGYAIASVDAALGRIEDAFAARERQAVVTRAGASEWVGQAKETAQVVLDRLSRPRGHRFDRVNILRYGYRVDEVDLVSDKITGYLESGQQVSVEQIRSVAFRMQRGGYRETQVDAVLDAVVEVMLAIR